MAWRNERTLYKSQCDLCKKSIVSTYPAGTSFPVYCTPCWNSDKWDWRIYAGDYDFSKPFFAQWKELFERVPRFALFNRSAINSDYSNMVGESKNVYLSVSVVVNCEDVYYSKAVDTSRWIVDSLNIKESEGCYENIDAEKNFNCQNTFLSRNCIDSHYLIDCTNCSDCFMCSNLRNQRFYIRNKKYSKEDYFKEKAKINLGSRKERVELQKEYDSLCKTALYKHANLINSQNSTGNNLTNTKDCRHCFEGYDAENMKFCHRAFISKDTMDCDFTLKSEHVYEYVTGGNQNYNVRFSYCANGNVRNAEYVHSSLRSNDIFGCVGVKDGKYVILNKEYSKEAYEKMRRKIIEHMNTYPFMDKRNRIYKYGEFFPIELSPFAYNETPAQELEPTTKEEAAENGYYWKDLERKSFNITLPANKIPDAIAEVDEKVLNEVLGCVHEGGCDHQCNIAFKITQGEFQFYKKHSIPLPDKCPNCRYCERFVKVPLPKLFYRSCMCSKVGHNHSGDCPNQFETPYSPERPEKVYCESCYNKEVY